MTPLQPLAALLAQSERERDMALADMQRAQLASDAADAQAQQLLEYRRDYEKRWGAQFAREGKIELVRCYQSFIERLTQAVDQQARVAEHSKQQARQRRPCSARGRNALRLGAQADRTPHERVAQRGRTPRAAADRRNRRAYRLGPHRPERPPARGLNTVQRNFEEPK